MKKYEKKILLHQLEKEKEVIEELKKMYQEAEKQIDEKILMLMSDELTQSKIYQIEYQKALKKQISAILDNMTSNNYSSIMEYLKNSYEDGFIGTMYSLQQQGIPLIFPLDQEAVVKAIQIDSKLSEPLYEALGINTNELKKSIRNEVSRGLSNAFSYQDIARNVSNQMNIDFNKSIRIARTEGHRVNQQSTIDGMKAAKSKGADVLKQWDATLDGSTRPSHQMVDGEIKELDEKFSNGLLFPGDPNGAAEEVINCRCTLLQRARWALDDGELKTLMERANYYGLNKINQFEEFKNKYLDNIKDVGYNENVSGGKLGAYNNKNDPDGKKRAKHADSYYKEIRNSKKEFVIETIINNTNVEYELVSKMIDHLFINKYELDGNLKRFVPDYDIAESIRRLREGKDIQPHDLILIKHEAMEYDLMNLSGMKYEDAHNFTNKYFDYEKALDEWLEKKGNE